jgi:glycosyltransferase involved in cell wall biosynthesis
MCWKEDVSRDDKAEIGDVEVTIIIPHYNTPDYLRKLLDSIPQKESIQVVVVDDRSTYKIEEYKQLKLEDKYRHITFLYNTTDRKGAGVCRNIGIEKAVGKWLLFADADDYFLDNMFLKLQKYLNYDKDVVFFPVTSVELGTNKPAQRHKTINSVIGNYVKISSKQNELKLRYRLPEPWSKLINKKLVLSNNISFDEVLVSNDVTFSVKVGYYMKTFEIAEEAIYCVTKNRGSLTKVCSEENYDTRLGVFINNYRFLSEKLSVEDFKSLELNAINLIERIFVYKLGVRKIFWLRKKMKENNIKLVVNIKSLNPFHLGLRTIRRYRSYKADRKYYLHK